MKKLLLILVFSIIYVPTVYASGVDNYGIDAKSKALGGAVAAQSDNPFAVYFNPAGLSNIESQTVSAGVLIISPNIDVNNYSIGGGTESNFSNKEFPIASPHLGYSIPVTDSLTFGAAIYSPWGLEIDWSDDTSKNPGAHNSYHSYYTRTVITPSIAWKVSENLSIGGGISLGQSTVGSDYISYGSGLDIQASLEDDFNWSLNLGVIYKLTDSITTGITYRGRTDTDFEGDLHVVGMGDVSKLRMDYDHPEQIQAGIRYIPEHNKALSVELDVLWTNWSINKSQFETITPAFGGFSSKEIPRDWEDTTQVRLGVEWLMNESVSLRGGISHDPSPVPDETMDFIWPDGDKITYSLGMGYLIKNFTIDLVVSLADIYNDRNVDGESTSLNSSYGQSVSFNADGRVWIGGATLSYAF